MNDENNNEFPLVEIQESQAEKMLRRIAILGEVNSIDAGKIRQILSVVDQKKNEEGRELTSKEVINLAQQILLVREEFVDPGKLLIMEIQREFEEQKESYLREIEGSFKVQKRQKFKSPSWNF